MAKFPSQPPEIKFHGGASVLSALRRALFALFTLAVMVARYPATAQQQDWFRIGTGLGVEKPRVAVADFAPRSDAAKSHGALFTQVVRDDLAFSGILDMVSPSFYPQSQPSAPTNCVTFPGRILR
jgi:hypothetical protein